MEHSTDRVPRPSRVLCERAGILTLPLWVGHSCPTPLTLLTQGRTSSVPRSKAPHPGGSRKGHGFQPCRIPPAISLGPNFVVNCPFRDVVKPQAESRHR